MFTQLAVLVTLSASVLGNVFVTSPVASTTWNGGSKQTVSWQDNGNAPNLAAFGPAMISIYAGNAQQQTLLQAISPNTDVSKSASVDFTVNPSIGPNSDNYFIRIESLGLKDPANPQFPALAFSAKFTLASMTGTFNSTVQAQIDGQSTAPIGGSTPPASGPSSAGASPTTNAAPKTTAAPSASKASSSSTAKPSNAASPASYPRSIAVVAAVAAFAVAL